MGTDDVATPQPDPVDAGEVVFETMDVEGRLAELLEARHRFGLEKYGQPLRTSDGRDTVSDLKQELADAVMYARKAELNDEPVDEDVYLLLDYLTSQLVER